MFRDIKKRLLDNPESIVNILLTYDFYKPCIRYNEVRFGLYEGSNPTAIRIKLDNNDNLFVSDFSRNLFLDIINYIIKVRNVAFKDVLAVIKSELGIESFYDINTKRPVFGGFYNRISRYNSDLYVKTYPESILQNYKQAYNTRFAKDYINLETQRIFEVGYDVESQRITFPIRSQYGEIMGIKGRANWNVSDEEPKYLYLIPCTMSSTLYGYSQNFLYLQEDTIYIFESEKSVMQCYTYGFHNAVALGSNSLSTMQCKLLMGLSPKKVVFMLDKTLDLQNTYRNIEKLLPYTRMKDTIISFWDWRQNTSLPDKASPSDYGREILEQIINTEVVDYEEKMGVSH